MIGSLNIYNRTPEKLQMERSCLKDLTVGVVEKRTGQVEDYAWVLIDRVGRQLK